ncbi:hypothetical protein VCHA54P496_540001 [Vibrio chagasii]|nr:hypothetical protein VCHA54P495_530001 [Vibrio chagasii]CAH7334971.1 hypothetical protein VCHA54P496_540001 [Vibrio chagasii]CAH7466238.1 hypothetical protein VCHA54P486_560005 [Vibrio chagasii]
MHCWLPGDGKLGSSPAKADETMSRALQAIICFNFILLILDVISIR